ncbi:MAG: hypothetical protein II705_05250 [Clostridia bacterium]|nr:hypothetical protein [Clostridia bacterium]
MQDDLRKRGIIDPDDPQYRRRERPVIRKRRNIQAEREKRAQKAKKNRNRLVLFGIIFIIVVLLIRFGDLFTVSNIKYTFDNFGASIRGEDISTIDFTYEPENKYAMYKGGLVIGSSEGVRIRRPNKGDAFVASRTFSDIQIEKNDRYVIAYDYLGQGYTVISGTEVESSQTVEGSILTARLSRGGGYSILTKITGYRGVITDFGSNHQIIYQYYVAKDNIVDLQLSPNNRRMAAAYIDTESESLKGGVSFFDITKDEPVARYDIVGEIPLRVEYKENNLIAVLHSGGFIFFRPNGRVVGEYSFEGNIPYLADLSQSGYACAVIGSDTSGDNGELVIVNNSGDLRGSYKPDAAVKKVLTNNSCVFLYTADNELIIVDWRGNLQAEVQLDSNTRNVLMDESNNIYALGLSHVEKIDY